MNAWGTVARRAMELTGACGAVPPRPFRGSWRVHATMAQPSRRWGTAAAALGCP